jgi:hypothetical protein
VSGAIFCSRDVYRERLLVFVLFVVHDDEEADGRIVGGLMVNENFHFCNLTVPMKDRIIVLYTWQQSLFALLSDS